MKTLKIFIFAALCGGALMSCEKETTNENETQANRNVLSSGIGGSMAQFTIIDNHLYTVDYKSLKVFNLADATNPVLLETINLGVGIETIYPQNDNLFIGTQNGVIIYDVSNPRDPQKISQFEHVTSCDPVVANDQYAIATLRGGTPCNGNINELNVIDISNLSTPNLAATYDLTQPFGLAFSKTDENIVYVCDGYGGLKAFNISDLTNIEMVMHLENIEAIDVIAADANHLVVLSRQGIYQFESSNPTDLVEKSFISVQ